MTYDNNNRLIRSDENYLGTNYVYQFYYTGNKLTRLTFTNIDNPAVIFDLSFTYNSKGQNTRQDDDISDWHVLMTYDDMGNCTRSDLYFGTQLQVSDNYTFDYPARNPYAAIPGVSHTFPFWGGNIIRNKRWFSSNRKEIYDNGTMYLINDYDPAKTTIVTGNHDFPTSATYYDRVAEDNFTNTFDYENCNGSGSNAKAGSSQTNINPGSKTSIKSTKPFLKMGSQKSIKEQLQKMVQQLKK
jgi:hypothetical protein